MGDLGTESSMQKPMIAVAAAIALAVVAAAGYLALTPRSAHISPAMVNVEGAAIGGPFELTTHKGDRVTSADVIDGPTLVYFGYTFCPDICPVDTQIMADAVDILTDRGVEVTPIFVTVDPARDTPKELGYFVEGRCLGLRDRKRISGRRLTPTRSIMRG
jgi:protein SCO1/2